MERLIHVTSSRHDESGARGNGRSNRQGKATAFRRFGLPSRDRIHDTGSPENIQRRPNGHHSRADPVSRFISILTMITRNVLEILGH